MCIFSVNNDDFITLVSTWYQTPVVFPAVTRSDHETVLFQHMEDPPRPTKSVKVTYRRINAHNRTALLFTHLQHNWSYLYHMNSCQQVVDYFLFIYCLFVKSLHACCPVICQ